MNTVRRLPLWKECLDEMRRQGLEYGKTYPVAFFTEQLSVRENTIQFNMGIHHIRESLEGEGFYLSADGQQGQGFCLLPASANEKIVRSKERRARRTLRRAVTLARSTDRKTLTEAERVKLDTTTERVALKSLFMDRRTAIERLLREKAPKLLQAKRKSACN